MQILKQEQKERWIQNIIDQILESQIKLGYAKESVYLYYPVESLNALLFCEAKDGKEMLSMLEKAFEKKDERLGKLTFHLRKGRIEVLISPQGVEYVHEHIEPPRFLVDLIHLFEHPHDLSIKRVEDLFASYSRNYVCKKMKEGADFDYVIHFADKNIDPYYYCIQEEMGHTIYHRFTKEDYELF